MIKSTIDINDLVHSSGHWLPFVQLTWLAGSVENQPGQPVKWKYALIIQSVFNPNKMFADVDRLPSRFPFDDFCIDSVQLTGSNGTSRRTGQFLRYPVLRHLDLRRLAAAPLQERNTCRGTSEC